MRDFTSRMHTENFVKRVKLMLNTLNTHTHTHTHRFHFFVWTPAVSKRESLAIKEPHTVGLSDFLSDRLNQKTNCAVL